LAVIVRSQSLNPEVYANSGSAKDIQIAVDEAAIHGIADVHIPEGTFNFVEIGEPWMTVNIPAGVNLYGAPTERTSGLPIPERGMNPNDQVIEWKTVLVMPYDVPGPSDNPAIWFKINGDSDPNKPSLFSDLKLVGYRYFDPSSETVHEAFKVEQVVNLHVDHCYFRDTTCAGVEMGGGAFSPCCAVIDHCKFVNTRVHVEGYIYNCDVHYGVCSSVHGHEMWWEDNIDNVIGQYNNYTVFIEDCYFSKWRHCVTSNDGVHYVFRYNTIEDDVGYGSLDAHGTYNYVGTRAIEIYNNKLLNPEETGNKAAIWIRGGGGVIFNNTVEGYASFASLTREGDVEKCWPHDLWVWDNSLPEGVNPVNAREGDNGAAEEGVDYFLHAKPDYTPYPYPHPLTLEATP